MLLLFENLRFKNEVEISCRIHKQILNLNENLKFKFQVYVKTPTRVLVIIKITFQTLPNQNMYMLNLKYFKHICIIIYFF